MEWQTLLQQILAIVLSVVGTTASVFLTVWIKRVAERRGIEVDQANLDIIGAAIRNGVYAAERWAMSADNKPTGSEKLDFAIKSVKIILQNKKVKDFTDEQLKKLMESFIQQEYNFINEQAKKNK